MGAKTLQAKVDEAAAYLREALSTAPELGIILGSGLNPIADVIEEAVCLPYADVPYMCSSTAPGHVGQFVCGKLGGKQVLCMQGRLHAYEGHDPASIAFPIQVMGGLGIKALILTNATGGINTGYEVGEVVLIKDHINFTGKNPLIGAFPGDIAGHCPDMTTVYSARLRKLAWEVGAAQGLALKEGVYLGLLGPSFETPAEIRAFRTLGADLVGMSTVFEVIGAADCGIEVLAISLVTNMAAGVLDQPITGDEIIEIGKRRSAQVCSLVQGVVEKL